MTAFSKPSPFLLVKPYLSWTTAAAAPTRMAKTHQDADKEEGGKLVWWCKIKGQNKVEDGGTLPEKESPQPTSN